MGFHHDKLPQQSRLDEFASSPLKSSNLVGVPPHLVGEPAIIALAQQIVADAGIQPQPPISLRHKFTAAHESSLTRVLQSENIWRSNSEAAQRLVATFRERLCPRRHLFPVASATAALHISLSYLVETRGPYVLVPSFTWHAAPTAVIAAGGFPVFVDVSPTQLKLQNWRIPPGIAPDHIACALVSHLFGQPLISAEFLDWLDETAIPLVEDAAQAVIGSVGRRPLGQLGTVAVYSFNGSKQIPAGEGGLLATDDDRLAAYVDDFIMAVNAPADVCVQRFNASSRGWNYRLSSLIASLAESLVRDLDDRVTDSNAACRAWAQMLGDSGSSPIVSVALPYCVPEAHLGMPILVSGRMGGLSLAQTREAVYFALRLAGVPISTWVSQTAWEFEYVAEKVDGHKFAPNPAEFPGARTLADSLLIFPTDTRATTPEVLKVAAAVLRAVRQRI